MRAGIENITLGDINPKGTTETAKLIKKEFPDAGILEVKVDVTDEASVTSMVEKAIAAFGTLECGKEVHCIALMSSPRFANCALRFQRQMQRVSVSIAICRERSLC